MYHFLALCNENEFHRSLYLALCQGYSISIGGLDIDAFLLPNAKSNSHKMSVLLCDTLYKKI